MFLYRLLAELFVLDSFTEPPKIHSREAVFQSCHNSDILDFPHGQPASSSGRVAQLAEQLTLNQ
jgi:hypothetical protein